MLLHGACPAPTFRKLSAFETLNIALLQRSKITTKGGNFVKLFRRFDSTARLFRAQPLPVGAKPFVEVGSTVAPGEPVCIVEAMKMMNEVAAGEGGKVAEILVENGDWVEFEQVLMYLEPADD